MPDINERIRDELVASVRGMRPELNPGFIACLVDDTLAAIKQRGYTLSLNDDAAREEFDRTRQRA